MLGKWKKRKLLNQLTTLSKLKKIFTKGETPQVITNENKKIDVPQKTNVEVSLIQEKSRSSSSQVEKNMRKENKIEEDEILQVEIPQEYIHENQGIV